jgi:uncharacterized small protein (TIGR04563 family)
MSSLAQGAQRTSRGPPKNEPQSPKERAQLFLVQPMTVRSGQTAPPTSILAGLTNLPNKPDSSPTAAREAAGDSASDKRKQSLYFPESMLEEIKHEAMRLDRSLSWIVQRAWKTARPEVKKIPSSREVEEREPEEKAVSASRPMGDGGEAVHAAQSSNGAR